MKTVVETPEFIKQAKKVWSAEELEDFVSYISLNPLAGDVIKGTGGVRKVRWGKDGSGKRSGVRVIYIHVEVDGTVTLIAVYAKNVKENILNKEIKRLQND